MSDEMERAEQFRDECERLRVCVEIIEASAIRPLTKDERTTLALEAGVNRYTQEAR